MRLNVKVDVNGFRGTEAELKRYLRERVEQAASYLEGKVKLKLTGQRSGRVYPVPGTGQVESVEITDKNGKRRKVRKLVGARFYTASAPGEAPAVRFGDLRKTIRYKMILDRPGVIAAQVGSPLEYAIHLEFGTRKMAPRPFLFNTFDEEKENVENIIGQPL